MSGGGKIGDLVRRLELMASPSFRYDLAKALADEAGKQYRRDFQNGTDPYGEAWAKGKKESGKTLVDTGYLRASGEPVSITPNGFRFRVYAPYGVFHQSGTKRMPQRMIVPSGLYGLGKWGEPFNRVAAAKVRALLKG